MSLPTFTTYKNNVQSWHNSMQIIKTWMVTDHEEAGAFEDITGNIGFCIVNKKQRKIYFIEVALSTILDDDIQIGGCGVEFNLSSGISPNNMPSASNVVSSLHSWADSGGDPDRVEVEFPWFWTLQSTMLYGSFTGIGSGGSRCPMELKDILQSNTLNLSDNYSIQVFSEKEGNAVNKLLQIIISNKRVLEHPAVACNPYFNIHGNDSIFAGRS